MKRILGVGLLLILSSMPLLAAKNSEELTLSTVRVGAVQLPAGIYQVTWTETAGSQAKLTFREKDVMVPKTVTVSVRVVDGKQPDPGAITSIVNGAVVLREVQTANKRFILEDAATASK